MACFLLRLCLHGGNAGHPEQSGLNIRWKRTGLVKKVSCGCRCGFVSQVCFPERSKDKILRGARVWSKGRVYSQGSQGEEMGEQVSDHAPLKVRGSGYLWDEE